MDLDMSIGEIGAMIDTALIREWCLVDAVGPTFGWRWVEDTPTGPSTVSVARLQALQEEHGVDNVTTGNANPPRPSSIGLYLRFVEES